MGLYRLLDYSIADEFELKLKADAATLLLTAKFRFEWERIHSMKLVTNFGWMVF